LVLTIKYIDHTPVDGNVQIPEEYDIPVPFFVQIAGLPKVVVIRTQFRIGFALPVKFELRDQISISVIASGILVNDAPDMAGRAPDKFPEVKEVNDAPDIAGRAPDNLLDATAAISASTTDASGSPPATNPAMVPAVPSIVIAIPYYSGFVGQTMLEISTTEGKSLSAVL
jgi:hypothetical protein